MLGIPPLGAIAVYVDGWMHCPQLRRCVVLRELERTVASGVVVVQGFVHGATVSDRYVFFFCYLY